MLLPILTFATAVISLISFFSKLFSEGRLYDIILLITVFILALSTGFFIFQNRQMASIESQAKVLLDTWPEELYNDPSHDETFKAIVLNGLVFLEKYKKEFPTAFEYAREQFNMKNSTGNSGDVFDKIKESERNYYLAKAMLNSIRGVARLPLNQM